MSTMTPADLDDAIASVSNGWWHSIDLGDGVVTPGRKSMAELDQEFRDLRLPDLTGKSVLDVGAWDGAFSFACERAGAERVVALDYFTWSLDFSALPTDLGERHRRGEPLPVSWEEIPEAWKPETLPGKRGFDVAHQALGSKVESVVGDFMTVDLDELGPFDVVLFLGVLYHLTDPVGAARRLATIARELAVVETQMVVIPGADNYPAWHFYPTIELNGDPTNWWAPNRSGLIWVLKAAGFSRVEVPPGPIVRFGPQDRWPQRLANAFKRSSSLERAIPPVPAKPYRTVALAWK